MTKISLRAYNREIEGYIENNQTDKAISHCKHILNLFPKHIDTYRLFGRAYLKKQQFSEARDIFNRVLSVFPDDFSSQLGMSSICENEGNLDAAIWHMERAFEVQPSNTDVQDDLRRLYTRRDGVEPPKLRLTKGALIRMYTRGELYPQAINEIQNALSIDPQRNDLEIILARIYFLMGQENESLLICKRLLEQMPFCFEANSLFVKIMKNNSQEAEVKENNQRIILLDPYANFISSKTPSTYQVPDNAVMIEYMDNNSAQLNIQQDKNINEEVTIDINKSQSDEDLLPDWMKTAVTTEINIKNAATEVSDELSQTEKVEGINATDLPEWITSLSPNDISPTTIIETQQVNNNEIINELPDWLNNIDESIPSNPEFKNDNATTWENEYSNIQINQESDKNITSSNKSDDILQPEWLQEIDQKIATGPSDDTPQASIDEMLNNMHRGSEVMSTDTDNEKLSQNSPNRVDETSPEWPDQLDEQMSKSPSLDVPQDTIDDLIKSLQTEEDEIVSMIPDETYFNKDSNNQPIHDIQKEEMSSISQEDFNIISSSPDSNTDNNNINLTDQSDIPNITREQTYSILPTQEIESEISDGEIDESRTSKEKLDISSNEPQIFIDDMLNIIQGKELTEEGQKEIEVLDQTSIDILPEPLYDNNLQIATTSIYPEQRDEQIINDNESISNNSAFDNTQDESIIESTIFPQTIAEDQENISSIDSTLIPKSETFINSENIKIKEALPEWLENINSLPKEEVPAEPMLEEENSITPEALPEWIHEADDLIEKISNQDQSSTEELSEELLSRWSIDEELSLVDFDLLPIEESEKLSNNELMIPMLETPLTETQDEIRNELLDTNSYNLFEIGKQAFSEGNIGIALRNYNKLINNGTFLSEIIDDLENELLKYTDNVDILLSLGDAYVRSDRLQDALTVYTKAEELIS